MSQIFCDEKTGQYSFVPPSEKFDKTSRLWKDFLIFHKSHPEIYEEYKLSILGAVKQGRDIYSIYAIRENDRWNRRRIINNNHAPYYARLFIEEYPEYKSFFRLRKIKKE